MTHTDSNHPESPPAESAATGNGEAAPELETVVHDMPVDVSHAAESGHVDYAQVVRDAEQVETDRFMEKWKRYVPVLPMPLAYTFAALNVLIPGLGTICCGFSALCVPKPFREGVENVHTGVVSKDQPSRLRLWGVNCGIGLLQMGSLVLLFFVAWWWSITWAILIVAVSKHHQVRQHEEDEVVDSMEHDAEAGGTYVVHVSQQEPDEHSASSSDNEEEGHDAPYGDRLQNEA